METNERKSISCSMKQFNPIASDNSFIEVTEWTNGEGYDVIIDDKQYSLHYSEIEAINYLIKSLEYDTFKKVE